jgi:hypothetical protein
LSEEWTIWGKLRSLRKLEEPDPAVGAPPLLTTLTSFDLFLQGIIDFSQRIVAE